MAEGNLRPRPFPVPAYDRSLRIGGRGFLLIAGLCSRLRIARWIVPLRP